MNPLLLRDSAENDLASIAAVYAHHVLHSSATFEVNPPGLDKMARRRDVLERGLPYLVAERDGAVAGFAYAGAYRPRPAYRFTVEDSVYVHPDHTGQGCGRALLTALIARCEEGPSRQMIAVIGDSANHASMRLHQSLGFRHAGTLIAVGFKFEHWLDSVLMQRELMPRSRRV